MGRLGSLVVFLVVGFLVAWLLRNSGTGIAFIVAFCCAAAATWLFERMSGQRAKKPTP